MEKKPTNHYFSISVGKEKKYLNVVITSDEEATGSADATVSNIGSADAEAGSNIGSTDTAADSNIGSADAADSNIGSADAAGSNIGSEDAAGSNIGSEDTAAGSNIGSADTAGSNIGSADTAANSNIGSADAAAGSNIGSADTAAGSNIGSADAADRNIGIADAAGSNIGNTGEADGISAEGSQDQNFSRVVSVNALAPAKEILLALPVQNIPNEALASILSYIAQRDAVTDSATYYGPLVTALVRSRYSEDDVEAIVNNAMMVQTMPSTCNEIENRRIAAEFEDFLNFRLQCKARAKEILSLMAEA